jgi:kinetochore protein Mis12/MTW1
MYKRALHTSAKQRKRAEERLDRLSFLASPSLDVLASIPAKANTMFQSLAAVPPLDPSDTSHVPLPDPGKRQWETGKSGYSNWAVGQLLEKNTTDSGGTSRSAVASLVTSAEGVGREAAIRAAVEATKSISADLESVAGK